MLFFLWAKSNFLSHLQKVSFFPARLLTNAKLSIMFAVQLMSFFCDPYNSPERPTLVKSWLSTKRAPPIGNVQYCWLPLFGAIPSKTNFLNPYMIRNVCLFGNSFSWSLVGSNLFAELTTFFINPTSYPPKNDFKQILLCFLVDKWHLTYVCYLFLFCYVEAYGYYSLLLNRYRPTSSESMRGSRKVGLGFELYT